MAPEQVEQVSTLNPKLLYAFLSSGGFLDLQDRNLLHLFRKIWGM